MKAETLISAVPAVMPTIPMPSASAQKGRQ